MTAPPGCKRGAASAVPSSSASSTASAPSTATSDIPFLECGTRAYWRASLALLFAG
ncbi:MAG TPA: MFS transporter, partial [Paraburkholderia sp.]